MVRECREEAGRLVAARARRAARGQSPGLRGRIAPIGRRAGVPRAPSGPGLHRARAALHQPTPRPGSSAGWTGPSTAAPLRELEVDLSPAWLPEQVRIEGLDDPAGVASSRCPSGATRLQVMLPASVLARKQWTLLDRGDLDRPRGPRPPGAPARAPRGGRDRRRGVAGVGRRRHDDPPDPGPRAGVDRSRRGARARQRGPPARDLREALAWRWTADAAEARVDRERIDQDPMASIHSRARISPDRRELSLEGTLLLSSGAAPLESLPLWIDQPGDPLASWRFRDEAGGELTLQADRGTGPRAPRVSPRGIGRAA